MRYPLFSFTYNQPHIHSRARLGILTTPHGVVETPAFIFCATKADIKTVPIDVNSQVHLTAIKNKLLLDGVFSR